MRLHVILVPFLILCFLFGSVFIYGEAQRCRIHDEICSYVLENRDEIVLTDSYNYQEFFYTATGLLDGGVEYGYYYSPTDRFNFSGESFRNGYRIYGIPDDDTDWYYSERICENWFYYEIHDG